jgi:hypothetical protein
VRRENTAAAAQLTVSVLSEHEGFLNKFEIGQIIILQPADLDQAFALIPR